MPILAENFRANALSGTVLVTDGYANLALATNPYVLEGNKSFIIKIRKGGIDGQVVATSPTITLLDNSQFVSLTANVSTVAEGNLVSFTLVTANAADNANVYYSILPVTSNVNAQDFVGANVGKATIFNNQAVFSYFANADYSIVDETGETFKVQLRTNSVTGNIVYTTSNVAITDFYKTINVFRFEESASGIAEGSSVTFTVYAHNVTPGSLLYYYTSGNADITGSNTGSVVMNGVSNTITLTTASTVPGNQTRNFRLVLSGSNLGAPIATSNTISVADLALTSITATGGTVALSGGYKIHQFTTSGNLTITGASPLTQMEYLAIAGGGSGGGGDMTFNGWGGSGGGAGGVLIGNLPASNAGNISVVIGAGGTGRSSAFPSYAGAGSNGSNTVLNLNLIAIGGGAGGNLFEPGRAGGSGGGGAPNNSGLAGYPGQGNSGGPGSAGTPPSRGGTGGGGGYGSSGSSGVTFPPGQDNEGYSGMGGIGLLSSITGSNVQYAGGGGGAGSSSFAANVGRYGGGNGLNTSAPPGPPLAAGSGNVNTGGGGGGIASWPQGPGYTITSGAGGSGIVVIRYPWQPLPFYTSVTANSSAVIEGSNAFFLINTTFANATTLYYDTVGNVTSSNFVNGNTGSFTVTSNATVLRLETIANIPLDESKFFALRIREDSVTGNIALVSSNVTIYDANINIYIQAIGGNVFTLGGYRTHIFTTSDNFIVTDPGKLGGVEYFVVAGGGGGQSGGPSDGGGGGGAGGVLYGTATVEATTYVATVGSGGGTATRGSNTSILSLVAVGGGAGGATNQSTIGPIGNGGSGGGGSLNVYGTPGFGTYFGGGAGIPGQGNPGGRTYYTNPAGGWGSGGGGAGAAGADAGPYINAVSGGIGISSPLSPSIPGVFGTPGPASGRWFAGGGGSGGASFPSQSKPPGGGSGGAGGGGKGGDGQNATPNLGNFGNVNTGGGAGGGGGNGPGTLGTGGSGGSGVIIIRYPFA